ncbi:probable glutamate--tRNA ligase, mitochondrial isoform X2 [Coccinella septempunctata]|uniref:probable glutamate--tRNA ligase, mitochondrial isoform X2 n=1 Tax=Coccinella septempunctata TaxID=41139 RepID=UPI001D068405|nr:probable glutamate--tRNA ligase, mitochondrial isoform X2 [Coccinella septempunctata]
MLKIKQLGLKFFSIRFYSSDAIRVRFAPSPTGYLHLGGLRTALYNFLFSKSKNGTFILRIEDTDQSRLVDGAIEQLVKDLTWAGIEIQEGPKVGGNYGPYIQSQRLDLYREQIEKLLNNGSAYYCFCTERRLDLLRREAIKNREVPKYDNKCRHLTTEEIKKNLEKGEKYCVRFKLSSDVTSYEDLVYGKITYDVALNEGDPVIIKSDGYPTYHFANIVDDHFMKISHVLRGLEWQISTTKHIQMYRAFGWDPPNFGHLPLLLNSDGTKLSKRQNDIKIAHFKEKGIFPLALLNYVVNAGGGFEKDLQQNVKMRIHTIDELANGFDITRLSTHSGRLMPELLFEFNQQELKRLLKNEHDEKELLKEVVSLLQEHFKKSSVDSNLQLDEDHIRSILHWSVNRITKLSDLLKNDMLFLWTMPKSCKLKEHDINSITELLKELEVQDEFSREKLAKFLKKFADQQNIKYSMFMKTLRSVLSGLKKDDFVGRTKYS